MMLSLKRSQYSFCKLLEIPEPNPQLLLGWSKGPENAREPESQQH